MWRNQPHGQCQVVGSTLKLEPFLTRKEETKEGYRAPRPLEVRRGMFVYRNHRKTGVYVSAFWSAVVCMPSATLCSSSWSKIATKAECRDKACRPVCVTDPVIYERVDVGQCCTWLSSISKLI